MSGIFLSHSSNNKSLARQIATDLRSEGIYVWLDEWEILVGDSITQKKQEGLSKVALVGVLLTKSSVDAGWVEKEWQSKLGEEAKNKKVVILPIKGDNCQIPLLLQDKKYADFSKNYQVGFSELLRAIVGHTSGKKALIDDIRPFCTEDLMFDLPKDSLSTSHLAPVPCLTANQRKKDTIQYLSESIISHFRERQNREIKAHEEAWRKALEDVKGYYRKKSEYESVLLKEYELRLPKELSISSMEPPWWLISGETGTGKTTIAKEIQSAFNAVFVDLRCFSKGHSLNRLISQSEIKGDDLKYLNNLT